jgi:hypothetical protein
MATVIGESQDSDWTGVTRTIKKRMDQTEDLIKSRSLSTRKMIETTKSDLDKKINQQGVKIDQINENILQIKEMLQNKQADN